MSMFKFGYRWQLYDVGDMCLISEGDTTLSRLYLVSVQRGQVRNSGRNLVGKLIVCWQKSAWHLLFILSFSFKKKKKIKKKKQHSRTVFGTII